MVASSYAAPCRDINDFSHLSKPFLNTVALPGDAPLGERDVLLSLFSRRGDIVLLDDALAVIEQQRPEDPYAVVVGAVLDGLLVAEFGPRTRGFSLHPIVLRRL